MNRAATAEGNHVHFWCPGCDIPHGIVYGSPNGWTWNGSLELPTFSPSVLMQATFYKRVGGTDEAPECEEVDEVCHSFVSKGVIQFLSDSTHLMSGQTVELPLWPYDDV